MCRSANDAMASRREAEPGRGLAIVSIGERGQELVEAAGEDRLHHMETHPNHRASLRARRVEPVGAVGSIRVASRVLLGFRSLVDCGVRRSMLARLVAFVLALTAGFGGPGLAVAHGLAHDHLRREHLAHDARHVAVASGRDGARGAGMTLAAPEHDHAHGHATMDVAPGERATQSALLAAALVAANSSLILAASDQPLVHRPALFDRALLARSDPATGPPPRLRAPPVG